MADWEGEVINRMALEGIQETGEESIPGFILSKKKTETNKMLNVHEDLELLFSSN